jgi:phospholipid/cholesterol/gamma-HCH transport system substrate-binding protein
MSAFRVGIFIVVALLIFAAGVFLIGDKDFLFSRTYRLNAAFQTVAGLTDGAEVRVGGIHRGTVKHINLPVRPDQKVIVQMNLAKETANVIKNDSVASVQAEGLIGDKYVEISFGSDQAEKVKEGDTIRSEAPLEVSALVKKADGILNDMQGAMKNVGQTATNIDAISAKINNGTGTLGSLVNDKTMYQKVNAGATAFSEDMEALKHNFLLRGFFKSRGYENAADVGKHEIPKLPAEQPAKTFAYDSRKLFGNPDKAKLTNQKALAEAARYLENGGFGLAVVKVDAGMLGDSEKARELTRARATVVRDYLVENFKLDDTRLKTMGLGKTDSGTGKVEIAVYPAAKAVASRR